MTNQPKMPNYEPPSIKTIGTLHDLTLQVITVMKRNAGADANGMFNPAAFPISS